MREAVHDSVLLHRFLYDALDQSDDIVVLLEQLGADAYDLAIASANAAFCRTTGYNHDELIGRSFLSLVAADAREAAVAEVQKSAATHRPLRSELLCDRKDGAQFWFGLHMMPVHDTDPPSFAVLGRDITESRAARQQAAAVQGLLAKVFQCVRAPVAILSDAGVIQMSNPALDQMLGYKPGALVGKRAIDCITPEARPAVLAARERQAADGHDYTLATRLMRGDGQEVPVEVTSVCVQRDDLRRFRIITAYRLSDTQTTRMAVRVAGKIRLIGLEEVREALGSKWPALAERAMASAEHVIRHRCGARDTYSRTTDGGFLICFADCTEDEAAMRASAMAREIRTKLIGEDETRSAANVSAITASVEVPDVPGQSHDTLAAIIGDRLNAKLGQVEADARETLSAALHNKACRLEQVRSRRTHDVVAQFVKLPPDLERRIQAAYSALPLPDRQGFDLDRLVLGIAADQAVAQVAAGGSLLTMVNLDFGMFLDRRRAERYVAACEALDPRLRERLVLVLSDIPKGFPKSRMLETVLRLRPFCHGIGFQADQMEPPAVDPSLLNGAIVVLQDERPALRRPTDAERLSRLIDGLHVRQAHVLLRQVATWGEVQPLARAGIDLISVIAEERDGVT